MLVAGELGGACCLGGLGLDRQILMVIFTTVLLESALFGQILGNHVLEVLQKDILNTCPKTNTSLLLSLPELARFGQLLGIPF